MPAIPAIIKRGNNSMPSKTTPPPRRSGQSRATQSRQSVRRGGADRRGYRPPAKSGTGVVVWIIAGVGVLIAGVAFVSMNGQNSATPPSGDESGEIANPSDGSNNQPVDDTSANVSPTANAVIDDTSTTDENEIVPLPDPPPIRPAIDRSRLPWGVTKDEYIAQRVDEHMQSFFMVFRSGGTSPSREDEENERQKITSMAEREWEFENKKIQLRLKAMGE